MPINAVQNRKRRFSCFLNAWFSLLSEKEIMLSKYRKTPVSVWICIIQHDWPIFLSYFLHFSDDVLIQIVYHIHSPVEELEMRKNLSKDFKGATRMALMRALKWAPTWYVSADISTFISYPDLIQRLAIKGISGVSPDLSSGGSFRSSHSGHSHSTLENNWEVFLHFEFPCRTVAEERNITHWLKSGG